jgi:hypothetical protein
MGPGLRVLSAPNRTLRPFGSLRTLRTIGALRAFRTLGTFGSLGPLRTVRSFGPLRPNRSVVPPIAPVPVVAIGAPVLPSVTRVLTLHLCRRARLLRQHGLDVDRHDRPRSQQRKDDS